MTVPPRHPVLVLIWKIGSIIVGVLLLVLGIIGLFLPILQGVVMIVGGLAILSAYSPMAKRILGWLKRKFHFHHETSGPEPESLSEPRPEPQPGQRRDESRTPPG